MVTKYLSMFVAVCECILAVVALDSQQQHTSSSRGSLWLWLTILIWKFTQILMQHYAVTTSAERKTRELWGRVKSHAHAPISWFNYALYINTYIYMYIHIFVCVFCRCAWKCLDHLLSAYANVTVGVVAKLWLFYEARSLKNILT